MRYFISRRASSAGDAAARPAAPRGRGRAPRRRVARTRGLACAALTLALAASTPPAARAAAAPLPQERQAPPPLVDQVRVALVQQAMQTPAGGQQPGAPAATPGAITSAPLPISLSEAIARGLDRNLGILVSQAGIEGAEGARWQALSTLLPDFYGSVGETRQKINLDQFGFSFPGFPKLIGPFNVFDARISASQAVVDLSALAHLRGRVQGLQAAKFNAQDARDTVVLAVANLYLDTVAGISRIEAAEAEVNTAKALFDQASDMKQAGTIAGIDVLRAQVQYETEQQQLIVLRNTVAKQKLGLARAIGIDPRQPIELSDRVGYHAMAPLSADEAITRAISQRADLQAATALVSAAEAEKFAAQSGRIPTLHVMGNIGPVGQTVSGSLMTYAFGAEVHVPIFEGGIAHARTLQADAELRQRRAQMEDLKRQVQYDVQTALLDLGAADERVRVAQHTTQLAQQTQEQARDRFRAGVASNLEVVQAQEAVARANEAFISSVYEHNLAKAALARSLGVADKSIIQFISGAQQ
jgi:outer membrane protein TolC